MAFPGGSFTFISSIILCTVAACIFFINTVLGKVIPTLAFEASNWFVFNLFNMAPLVANVEAVCDGPVGCIGVVSHEYEVFCFCVGVLLFIALAHFILVMVSISKLLASHISAQCLSVVGLIDNGTLKAIMS